MQAKRMAAMLSIQDYPVLDEKGGFCRWRSRAAAERSLDAGDLVTVRGEEGSVTAKLRFDDTLSPGISLLADYVIAPKMILETPGMTQIPGMLKYYTVGLGHSVPYAQYRPRNVNPPEGSDLIEEWQFFHGLARRMNLDITMGVNYGFGAFSEAPPVNIKLSANGSLSSEELYERMCSAARIPLSEIRKNPHGHIFEIDAIIQPKDANCSDRLDAGNKHMLEELAEVLLFDFKGDRADASYPFRLIPRRTNQFMNSSGVQIAKLNRGKPYNPAYMHPGDKARLQLNTGDRITLTSRHDRIVSAAEEDRTVQQDTIAMNHCFGGLWDGECYTWMP